MDTKETVVLMTMKEVGAKLGLSKNAVYRAAQTGDIPVVRIGGAIRVPRAAFERKFESAEVLPARSAKVR